MNRVIEAISPKRFAIGTHSKMDSLMNIIKNGIKIPPPPRPPAFDKKPMMNRIRTPTVSRKVGGKINSFFSNML
jgi:hypothetical protein